MRTLAAVLVAAVVLACGTWEFYAIWTGFAGGPLWPFGWMLPGGFWHGLLFLLLGLPVLGLAAWAAIALLLLAAGARRPPSKPPAA